MNLKASDYGTKSRTSLIIPFFLYAMPVMQERGMSIADTHASEYLNQLVAQTEYTLSLRFSCLSLNNLVVLKIGSSFANYKHIEFIMR